MPARLCAPVLPCALSDCESWHDHCVRQYEGVSRHWPRHPPVFGISGCEAQELGVMRVGAPPAKYRGIPFCCTCAARWRGPRTFARRGVQPRPSCSSCNESAGLNSAGVPMLERGSVPTSGAPWRPRRRTGRVGGMAACNNWPRGKDCEPPCLRARIRATRAQALVRTHRGTRRE